MGNYRFKLSDMMPNVWFYKLKDMGKTRHHTFSHTMNKKHPPSTPPSKHQPHLSLPRQSYYSSSSDHPSLDKFHTSPIYPKASDTYFLPDPPRKHKKRTKRKSSKSSPKLVSSSVSAGCNCRTTLESVWNPDYSNSPKRSPLLVDTTTPVPDTVPEVSDRTVPWSSSCSCRVSSSATDIIIEVDEKSAFRKKSDGFNSVSELEFPPILTKPAKFKKKAETFTSTNVELEERNAHGSLYVKVLKEGSSKNLKEEKTPGRRSTSSIQGLKLRTNSPRLASKKIQAYNRKSTSRNPKMHQQKSISESFAVVKSSLDPKRDFRQSMLEMIVENNIRASKDLEDLLACYLSLNSNEYHDVIVKVFEQIWFDLTDIQL